MIAFAILLVGCKDSRVIVIENVFHEITTDESKINSVEPEDFNTYTTLKTGVKYHVILRFDVISKSNKNGVNDLQLMLEIEGLDLLGGKLNVSSTGTNEGEGGQGSTDGGFTVFKPMTIPLRSKDEVVSVSIRFEVEPVISGDSKFKFRFEKPTEVSLEAGAGNRKNFGRSEISKSFEIELTRLNKPEVYYSAPNTYVDWTHIQHAQAYEVYINEELVDTKSADYFDAGSLITYDITTYEKPFKLHIKSVSNDARFLDSFFSEVIEIK